MQYFLYLDKSEFSTLKCLQWFDQLCELNLDSNNINDESEFPFLQSLVHLSLSNNNICNLDSFLEKIATSFPKLQYINIIGNPLCPITIDRLVKNLTALVIVAESEAYSYNSVNQSAKFNMISSDPFRAFVLSITSTSDEDGSQDQRSLKVLE